MAFAWRFTPLVISGGAGKTFAFARVSFLPFIRAFKLDGRGDVRQFARCHKHSNSARSGRHHMWCEEDLPNGVAGVPLYVTASITGN